MEGGLWLTALAMGLAGGPHCLAMCGAACGLASGAGAPAAPRRGIASPGVTASGATASGATASGVTAPGVIVLHRVAEPAPRQASLQAGWHAPLAFQAGRLAGYCALGALAAASVQGLGWLSTQVAALRPLWTLMHAAALLLGLALVWQARQPDWMQGLAQRVWTGLRRLTGGAVGGVAGGGAGGGSAGGVAAGANPAASALAGLLWAFMPCGLLYSALLVAALSGSAAQGALTMAAFAAGSGAVLAAGPWAWAWLRRRGKGEWGVRVAGLALAALSAWALWQSVLGNGAPWCATP